MTRFLFTVLFASSTVAVAAPVPKAPPPPNPKSPALLSLATAKVNGQHLQITDAVQMTTYVQTVKMVNGQQVVEATPTIQVRTQTYQMALTSTKATTADGKELDADALTKKLGDGGAVVRCLQTIDPEWRKLFADDVIFLEPHPTVTAIGRGPIALPAVQVAPAVIRPLPAPPVAPPPPVEEKKDEKKAEENKKEEKK
jgi:hypothetical protein